MHEQTEYDWDARGGSEDEYEWDGDAMASLGRSLKSPVYLSRASSSSNGSRRPNLAARTFSHSSEVSVGSANSWTDEHLDIGVMSGINTPAFEKTVAESLAGREYNKHKPHQKDLILDHTKVHAVPVPDAAATPSSDYTLNLKAIASSSLQSARSARSNHSNHSNPITIELPAVRSYKSGPYHTPPEPLSARGDVPGGYFPLHEDPAARLHRPHPFADAKKSSKPSANIDIEPPFLPATAVAAAVTSSLPVMTEPPALTVATTDEPRPNMPVASYLPSGVRDTTLPMGKYYPSNYEMRNHPPPPPPSRQPAQVQPRPVAVAGLSSSVKSESQVPTLSNETFQASRQDSDVRRKLAQYQRDMIAQARLAASELLGSSAKTAPASQPPTATVMLNGVPLTGLRHFGASGAGKPLSPRLLPLGSPGPVTPMDLEGGDVGYLDRGRGPSTLGDMIARSGASSPAIEAGAGRFF